MSSKGYESYFYPKPESPATKYGFPADGSAVFYKNERFELMNPPQGFQCSHLKWHFYGIFRELFCG